MSSRFQALNLINYSLRGAFALGLCCALAACGSDSGDDGGNGGSGQGGSGQGGSGQGGSGQGGSGQGGSGQGGSGQGGNGGSGQCEFSCNDGCPNIVCECNNGSIINSTFCSNDCCAFQSVTCTDACHDDGGWSGASGGNGGSGQGGNGGSGQGGSGQGGSGGGGNPVGGHCAGNEDCASRICLFKGDADFGYCSQVCESFADCPSFWDCEEVGNASGTYCVQD